MPTHHPTKSVPSSLLKYSAWRSNRRVYSVHTHGLRRNIVESYDASHPNGHGCQLSEARSDCRKPSQIVIRPRLAAASKLKKQREGERDEGTPNHEYYAKGPGSRDHTRGGLKRDGCTYLRLVHLLTLDRQLALIILLLLPLLLPLLRRVHLSKFCG